YFTPEMLGVKWQMDVKYVPRECNLDKEYTEWYYQYTIIDEASRERFIYPYQDHCGASTCDFIKRAIAYFGYAPQIIQTDNGTEFTMPKSAKKTTVHVVDKLLNKLHIQHQLIRPRTPRHNGKVERSHRTDQECFYNHLRFSTFEELKEKMADWLERYNNRPHSSLRNRVGKRVWYTPLQKRAELLEDLKNMRDEYKIRFLRGYSESERKAA
ncbi:MAG: DDE-type integrase/transposase/recombinase, partial [Corallococcus sp.]|nr:DDE-type integrase/transposase/recombinase [Corallococcus sp.]